mmetsp:Transcript_1972/g.3741  ORF Transcript_1972/g.3741 Transcript_1972/m.3741 type:complete len:90 (-) Transcript_1972:2507-2776(-)
MDHIISASIDQARPPRWHNYYLSMSFRTAMKDYVQTISPPASLKLATSCLLTSPFQRAGLTNNPRSASSKPNSAIPFKNKSSLTNGSCC